jgi:hypothetical protein
MDKLSPAAQAVKDAFDARGIAAALLAATDKVLPAPYVYASQDAGLVRDELLSIAEELEAVEWE